MSKRIFSRREALSVSLGVIPTVLLACRAGRGEPQTAAVLATLAPTSTTSPDGGAPCVETHDQIEGPYYRAGAPERWDLLEPGMRGTVVEIDGRVTGSTCGAGQRDVELDVWQANADGRYDNDGSFGMPPPRYMLRGRLKTDASGRYHIRTVLPGHYMNGSQYRPAHVHVKARAPGFHTLTTQLYFPGDPYNDIDPFLHPSLIMPVQRTATAMKARFDFVLREESAP
jgi:protocatechuate 3,4-dioxygenase beta subunit